MSVVSMDVDRARHVAREMRAIVSEQRRRMRVLQGLLQEVERAWLGAAPQQYVLRQKAVLHTLAQKVDHLEALAAELEDEIRKYEEMAQHLDGLL